MQFKVVTFIKYICIFSCYMGGKHISFHIQMKHILHNQLVIIRPVVMKTITAGLERAPLVTVDIHYTKCQN